MKNGYMTIELLEYEVNRFNGIEIQADLLPQEVEQFTLQLTNSLEHWKLNGNQLVWLEVPIEKSSFIAPATAAGFVFHHSTERSLTMLFTLRSGTAVPTYATHYIGVGGVVFNERGELLVVSEWYRRDRSKPYYKLPGGALLPGEHLIHGVKREVLEETGIHADFDALVAFRHWHGYRWNKSDIYFICRLSALSEAITAQESEIEEAKWMDVNDYFSNENVSTFNKRSVCAALESPGIAPEQIEGYADPDLFEFFMPH